MKLVYFRRLKIGRRSRSRERKRSFKLKYQSPLNKDKIYLLKRPEQAATGVVDNWLRAALQKMILLTVRRCLDIRVEL
jgi:hypothetical protein